MFVILGHYVFLSVLDETFKIQNLIRESEKKVQMYMLKF